MPPLKKIILVSHTHWDREWYLPFQDFRWQLVKTLDTLIALMERNPRYRYFNLDGQTILLEDYLELRPSNHERIRKLVSDERLQIGPWYVLADEFLVSGEALIRNLLYGNQIAKQFGGFMPIGYVPDTFGHIAQLPQILNGFNLRSAVFWRGLEDLGKNLPTELRWQAPDGSEVLAVHLRTSYSTAANLPNSVDAALAQVLMPLNLLTLHSTSSAVLLLNGSDHLLPQPFLPDLLDQINSRLTKSDILEGKSPSQLIAEFGKSPITTEITGVTELSPFIDELFSGFIKELQGVQFQHGTLLDYINIIRNEVDITQLPLLEGEQHSSKYVPVLPGVFSARLYLKQANFAIQQLLEHWVEPFTTIAWWLGAPYPNEGIRQAWKYLLQNHPHDSICGCSVDATHADMERRFAWSQQLGTQILSEALNYINNQIESKIPSFLPAPCYAAFRVFNPHPWSHSDILRIQLELHTSPKSLTNLALYDSSGKKIPCQIVDASKASNSFKSLLQTHQLPTPYTGEPESPNSLMRIILTLIAPEIPSLGYQTFYLAPDSPSHPLQPLPTLTITRNDDAVIIKNPKIHLRFSSSDASLELYHKATKKRYPQLLFFEDSGDIGDEYNYCPPLTDQRVTSLENPKMRLVILEQGPIAVTLKITFHLIVPQEAHTSRKHRTRKTTRLPIENLITIYANQARIDAQTTITNTAKDHRLRVLFPTHLRTNSAWGDTPFYVAERGLTPAPQNWEAQLYPMMMEYYLTSILHRPNVLGKPMGWFEDSSTTHAQQTFVDVTDGSQGLLIASKGLPEYEVLNDRQRTIALTLLRSVGWLSRPDLTTRRGDAGPQLPTPGAQCLGTHTFHYSIIPHQKTWTHSAILREKQSFIIPLKAIQIPIDKTGTLPSAKHFLSIEPENVILSCLKKAEDADATILRIYEIAGTPTKADIKTAMPVNEIAQVDLDEQPNADTITKLSDEQFQTQLKPFQIQTVQLKKQ